jgi:phage major head subunit gpT-like protein
MPITPSNWLPIITTANTMIREAWSWLPTEYEQYTTTVNIGSSGEGPGKTVFEDAWIGRMPKMRLWSGPRLYQEPAPQTYTVVPEPFELTYTLDRFKYDDDGIGVFYPLLLDFAGQTKRWPEYQVRDLLEATGAWSSTQVQKGLDGIAFWSTAHQTNIYSLTAGTLNAGTAYANDFTGGGVAVNGVTVGGALSVSSLLTIIEYAPTIRAEDGERLGVTISHVMHPSPMKGQIASLLKSANAAASVGFSTWGAAQTQVGASDNVVARMGVDPIENRNLASFTKWYPMDLTKSVKPVRWVLREAVRMTPRVAEDDPIVFDSHQYAWGGWGRGAPAWSPSWLLFRSGP